MVSRRRFIGSSTALAATLGLARSFEARAQAAANVSARALAQMIRDRKISCVHVTEQCLALIDRVNPSLNAVVTLARERALAEAAAADAALAEGRRTGPLHGVPFTVSDAFDTSGIISTAGTLGRKQFTPATDATAVARLRSAGAILLGKTNTNELGFGDGGTADNLVFGATRNPHDAGRASGGPAAIVAAGGSYFDIGSAFNDSSAAQSDTSAISLEVTHGRIPRTGHVLGYGGAFDAMLALGPVARHSEDLEYLLRVLMGADDLDAAMAPVPLARSEDVALRSLRIAFDPSNDGDVTRCASYFRTAGCTLAAASLPMAAELADLRRRFIGADGGEHVRKLLTRLGTSQASPNLNITGDVVPSAEFSRLCESIDAIRSAQLEWFESFDLLIRPATAGHSGPIGLPTGAIRVASNSVPRRVQIVGRPWREDVVLAALTHIERSW